ncbi:MAG: lysophospholipid acyltransferase family protein [Gemmatimonadota bacterium]
MSDAGRERRIAWLARLGLLVLRMLAVTWRFRVVNRELLVAQHATGRSVVIVLWHGQLLPVLWCFRYSGTAGMVSEHGDGEIIGRIAAALGVRLVRGSTSQGAARALLAGAREVEAGHDLAITPDGPRGPAKSVAPGAAAIAQRTGAPILPVGVWASRAWHFKSWDKFMLPKPFASVRVAYGDPLHIDSGMARKTVDASGAVYAAIEAAIARAAKDGTA